MTPLDKADLEVLFNKQFVPIRDNLVVGESMKDAEGRKWRLHAREENETADVVIYLLQHGEYYALITVKPIADGNLEIIYQIRMEGAEHDGSKDKD